MSCENAKLLTLYQNILPSIQNISTAKKKKEKGHTLAFFLPLSNRLHYLKFVQLTRLNHTLFRDNSRD